MTNQERRLFVKELKSSLESFFFTTKKAARSVLALLDRSSEPAMLDEDELHKLKSKLHRIRATLKDAEKLVVADESVKLWLRELRDLECGVEDILEKLEFDSHRATLIQEFDSDAAAEPTRKRRRDREVSVLLSFSPLSCLGPKIKKIWEKYHEIASDREALRLTAEDGARRAQTPARSPSSSIAVGELHGRDADFNKLLELLRPSDCSDGCVYSVVPVVGMSGVGKTTIVQHLYNDERVRDLFDYRVWIYASQEHFDVVSITKTVIQGCGGDTRDLTELSLLQDLLVPLLDGKRFLLVLDEVWSVTEEAWERLEGPLRFAARGSKVVVTSCNTEVAKIMRADCVCRLSCLSDDSCWLICKQHAFDRKGVEVNLDLAQTGKEIVDKCRGLPLAAKAVGGLLWSLADEEEWTEVLQSDLWDNDDLVRQILPALRLSYDHLPLHLKHCFGYCSLFPKGYIFHKEQLIRLWMGQGFLEPNQRLQPEDVGQKYFDDLVGRCFFQQSPFYDVTEEMYEMHDLFHELAQSVAEKECSRIEHYTFWKTHESTRHSSMVPPHSQSETTIQCKFSDGEDLRTLLVIERPQYELDEKPFYVQIPSDLFSHLDCVRVLDLSHTSISHLPESIGKLIHLRYLGLRNTTIKRIPESACGLVHLQTLDLRHSYYLDELPQGIKYLVNLRHLTLPEPEYSNISIPSGLGLLTSLQTLNAFVVASDPAGCALGELRDLVNLSGELHISGLMNVCHAQDSEKAKLVNKVKLQKLVLQWWSSAARTQHLDARMSCEVLDKLQPHPNLEELTITGFSGTEFPAWLGECYFDKLVKVILEGCENCNVLPSLGQLPYLKHLAIQQMENVQSIGQEFCGRSGDTGGFPALETLELRKMYGLENWQGVEDCDFPYLQDLIISGCSRLSSLPKLKSLTNLKIQCCERLHELPVLPTLKYLKYEGFQKLTHLPQLPKLPLLETLEVGCCKQLLSAGSLQHLVTLRLFNITKCPMLNVSDVPLPGKFQVVPGSQENLKLVKCEQPASSAQPGLLADGDSNTNMADSSRWNEELSNHLIAGTTVLD